MIRHDNPSLDQHLQGEIIDTTYTLDLKFLDNQPPISRNDWLCDFLGGRRVVHVGCADHPSRIDQKIRDGTHLHRLLLDNCESVVGLDLHEDALNHLRNEHGMSGIYQFDLMKQTKEDIPFAFEEPYDFLVLGEIVEHIDNPVAFLERIGTEYGHLFNEIVVTVPNAYSSTHIKRWGNGFEDINSDHRFWFSPYTIARVVTAAGYTVRSVHMANISYRTDIVSRLYNRFMATIGSDKRRLHPARFGETVILVASR